MRAAFKGAAAIKAGGEAYLYCPASYKDAHGVPDGQFDAMVARAHYPATVKRTTNGLLGRAFNQPYSFDPPDSIDIDALDISGRTFGRMLRFLLRENILLNFVGALVDYDERSNSPKVICYKQEHILDYHREGARLVHLMVSENGVTFINGVRGYKQSRRIYTLDENGHAYSQLFVLRDDDALGQSVVGTKEDDWIAQGDPVYPTIAGERMDFIPFVFIGDVYCDESLVSPIADLALQYYDQSAQHRFGSSKVAQATPVLTWGVDAEDCGVWVKGIAEAGGIKLGSSSVISLPQGSKLEMVEISGSGLEVFERDMDGIVRQMIAMGARALADQSVGNVAFDTVRAQNSGEASTLSEAVSAFEEDIVRLLKMVFLMAGLDDVPAFKMSREFFDERLTPQDIQSLVQAWLAGAFPKRVLNDALRRSDWTQESDAQLDDQSDDDFID